MSPKAKKTPASLVPIRLVTRGLTNVTKSKKFLKNEKNFLDSPKLKSRKPKQFKKRTIAKVTKDPTLREEMQSRRKVDVGDILSSFSPNVLK